MMGKTAPLFACLLILPLLFTACKINVNRPVESAAQNSAEQSDSESEKSKTVSTEKVSDNGQAQNNGNEGSDDPALPDKKQEENQEREPDLTSRDTDNTEIKDMSGKILSIPLPPDFLQFGRECFLNQTRVVTAENNREISQALGYPAKDNFAWAMLENGGHCLMIILDAENASGAANGSLILPKYGAPAIGRIKYDIYVTWENPGDPNDCVELVFQDESDEFRVLSNSINGESGYTVKMPVCVFKTDGGSDQYLVPLYAIINETGGGCIIDPFGDGTSYVYTGDPTNPSYGTYESTDRGEYRTDVAIGGKTVSISSYWRALQLTREGTFTESDRFYQDSGDWVLIEHKGRYAFSGRVLAIKYETFSEYRGEYTALTQRVFDEPAENSGWLSGFSQYAWYVEEWDEDYIFINGMDGLYSYLQKTGEAAPRHTIAEGEKPDAPAGSDVFNGVIGESEFYHDGREEWIRYYYAEIGREQLEGLKSQLDDYYDSGLEPETEIHVYTLSDDIDLKKYIGKKISFRGEFFSAHTAYHMRNIVFMITDILEAP